MCSKPTRRMLFESHHRFCAKSSPLSVATDVIMGLKLIIPKHIWNAYNPSSIQSNQSTTQKRFVRRISTTRDCNTKLYRFHYGGIQRKRTGKRKNEIDHEGPCLKVTCGSCLEWHSEMVWERGGMPTTRRYHGQDHQQQLATRGAPVKMTHSEYCMPTQRKLAGKVKAERIAVRASLQRQCNVRLQFVSQRGKKRFEALVKKYERRERRRM